jgi:hypothetical protein
MLEAGVRLRRDDEARPAGVTRMRLRDSGPLASEGKHEGSAARRWGHARGGDEARTGEDTVLRSGEDNDEEAGVTRTTPRGSVAPSSEDGEEGGGRRLKGGWEVNEVATYIVLDILVPG